MSFLLLCYFAYTVYICVPSLPTKTECNFVNERQFSSRKVQASRPNLVLPSLELCQQKAEIQNNLSTPACHVTTQPFVNFPGAEQDGLC